LIADAGSLLVVLPLNRLVQIQFELLALAQGPLAGNVLEPMLKGLDFGTLLEQVRAGILLVEFLDFFDAVFNFINRSGKVVLPEAQSRFRAGLHHEDLWTKLLERPDQFIDVGISFDKIEDVQIAFGIADDTLVVLELQQANVAVMILERFELYLGYLLGSKRKPAFVVIMRSFVLIEPTDVMFEERSGAERTLSIGTPLSIHLQKTEVDAQLDFLLTVFTHEFPHHNLAGMVFPFIQDVRNIKIHRGNMNWQNSEVNASSLREQDYGTYE